MALPSTVFIDRDGVINRKPAEGEYVTREEEFELLPGSAEAIARLSGHGAMIFVVTNQQAVGKGLLPVDRLEAIHANMLTAIERAGGHLDGIFFCPHLAGTCECRKPATGLFEEARRLNPGVDFGESVVLGDAPSDMQAAVAIGARGILIGGRPGAGAGSLAEAASLLVSEDGALPTMDLDR